MTASLPKPGDTIDKQFLLRRELGHGAHGVVFEAQQIGLGRAVAVKMLLPDVLDDDGIVERFKREARLASSLSSPHSVIIHAFGVHEAPELEHALPYIAMEYLHGEDLGSLLRRVGTLTLDQSVVILRQVLASLAEAHRKGIVHRDLKPENIFLSQRDNAFVVKVLDFGIATAVEESLPGQRRLTTEGMVCGTPEYMSPEQAKGTLRITPAADIYALGCILYHMLSGRPPFLGPTPMTIALKHCQDPAPKLPPNVHSPFFRALVDRALSKEPTQRYRDAIEVSALLEEHLTSSSAGVSVSGSGWAVLDPGPSQEFLIPSNPNNPVTAIPDWALATTPSMNAQRAAGEDRQALDRPAWASAGDAARFYVAVGSHMDANFPVESADQPTVMGDEDDLSAPPLVATVSAPRRQGSNNATIPVPVVRASPASGSGAASTGPRLRGAKVPQGERRLFFGLVIALAIVLVIVLLTFAILILVSASGSGSRPEEQPEKAAAQRAEIELRIISTPPGAEVFEGDERLGETPLTLKRPRSDNSLTLTLKHPGYKTLAVELSARADTSRTIKLEPATDRSWIDPDQEDKHPSRRGARRGK